MADEHRGGKCCRYSECRKNQASTSVDHVRSPQLRSGVTGSRHFRESELTTSRIRRFVLRSIANPGNYVRGENSLLEIGVAKPYSIPSSHCLNAPRSHHVH